MISLGVSIASYGEVDFKIVGFLVQVSTADLPSRVEADGSPPRRLSLLLSNRAVSSSSRFFCKEWAWIL